MNVCSDMGVVIDMRLKKVIENGMEIKLKFFNIHHELSKEFTGNR